MNCASMPGGCWRASCSATCGARSPARPGPAGAVPRSRRGDPVPRRDRRHAARSAGPPPAGAGGPDGPSGRGRLGPRGRRPDRRRDPPGPRGTPSTPGRSVGTSFFRLDVVPFRVPPLRERWRILPELFATSPDAARPRSARLGPDALAVLERHPWPGNVRELENLVRRLSVLLDDEVVTAADLERHTTVGVAGPSSPVHRARRELRSLRELQDEYIGWVVDHCGGNKTQRRRSSGSTCSTIHRRERSVGETDRGSRPCARPLHGTGVVRLGSRYARGAGCG